MSLETKILEIIDGPLNHIGFNVVQVKFREADAAKLEVLLERLDGTPITVADCTLANRTISTHLDIEDPINRPYLLEVSSAGIDRPLFGYNDYSRFVGYKVLIQTAVAYCNSKKFKGFLENVTESHIYLRSEAPQLDDVAEIPLADITKGKLDLDYMIDLKMKERKKQK